MSLELLDVVCKAFKAHKAFKVHVTPEQSYEIQTLLEILKPVHLDTPYLQFYHGEHGKHLRVSPLIASFCEWQADEVKADELIEFLKFCQ